MQVQAQAITWVPQWLTAKLTLQIREATRKDSSKWRDPVLGGIAQDSSGLQQLSLLACRVEAASRRAWVQKAGLYGEAAKSTPRPRVHSELRTVARGQRLWLLRLMAVYYKFYNSLSMSYFEDDHMPFKRDESGTWFSDDPRGQIGDAEPFPSPKAHDHRGWKIPGIRAGEPRQADQQVRKPAKDVHFDLEPQPPPRHRRLLALRSIANIERSRWWSIGWCQQKEKQRSVQWRWADTRRDEFHDGSDQRAGAEFSQLDGLQCCEGQVLPVISDSASVQSISASTSAELHGRVHGREDWTIHQQAERGQDAAINQMALRDNWTDKQ